MYSKESKIEYSKELLERIKNGDNGAKSLVYTSLNKLVYKKAYEILKNHQDTEDVVQDTFIKAFEKIDTLNNPKQLPPWICRIAQNKAKDLHKQKRYDYLEDKYKDSSDNEEYLSSDVVPETITEKSENIEILNKLVSKLSEKQRIAIVLNRIEGYTFSEISQMLNCPESTVKTRVRSAENKLIKEAEKLKEQGYTLNGLTPLDFFTLISKQLGINSGNLTSILGSTATSFTRMLVLKVVSCALSVIVVVTGGVAGGNYIYNKLFDNKNTKPVYQKLTDSEINYVKTLIRYTVDYQSINYSQISDYELLNILNSYYSVRDVLKDSVDFYPNSKVEVEGVMPTNRVSAKSVQQTAKEAFGNVLPNDFQDDEITLKKGYYYLSLPMGGRKCKLEIIDIKYSEDKSKVTVDYIYNSNYAGDKDQIGDATFVRNNNKKYPLRIVSNVSIYAD